MKRSVFVGSALAAFALPPLGADAILPADRSSKIAMMAVAATMIELPPAWICEIIFAAELASEAACDPALCRIVEQYAQPVAPASNARLVQVDQHSVSAIFSGQVGPPTVALYQRAVDSQAIVAADEIAVAETVNRRFTARKRSDKVAIARQEAQFLMLVRQTAANKQRANTAWSAFAAYAKKARLVDKRQKSPHRALAEIREAGFSPPKLAMMRRLGMSDAFIALARTLVAQTPTVSVPASFIAAIPTIIALNNRNGDIVACTCRPS